MTGVLSSSSTSTPGDFSYHAGGAPSMATTFPIQTPSIPSSQNQNSLFHNLPSDLMSKSLTKKDELLIEDDI